jgi:hypothetical protein
MKDINRCFINKIIQDFKQISSGVKAEDDICVVIALGWTFIVGVVKDIPYFFLGNALVLER